MPYWTRFFLLHLGKQLLLHLVPEFGECPDVLRRTRAEDVIFSKESYTLTQSAALSQRQDGVEEVDGPMRPGPEK